MTDKKIKSQTILRASHDKQNPYVMISKKVLTDRRLSPKGMGLMCYLLGLPDHWRICVEELCTHFSAGEKSIKSGLRELILLGYIERFQPKLLSGTYGPVEMIVHEEPSKKSKQVKKSPELHDSPLACFGLAVDSLPEKMPKIEEQVIFSPELHDSPLACFGLAQKGTLVINDQVNNIYINNNNKHDLVQDPEGDVVVDFEMIGKLAKIGVNKNTALSWIRQYGKEYVENKLRMLQEEISRGTIRHSRAGWLKKALEQNYAESEIKKSIEEREVQRKEKEEEEREARIKKWREEEKYLNSPEREKKYNELKKMGGLKGLIKSHQNKKNEVNLIEKVYPKIYNSNELEDKLDRVFEGVKNNPERKIETVKTLREILDNCITSVRQTKSC